QSAFIGTLYWRVCDDDRSLQTLEFSGSARQLACVGLAGQEIALLKDLIIISIGVSAVSVRLHSLSAGIDQPTHLASTAHVVQDRISLIIRCGHYQVLRQVLLPFTYWHRISGRNLCCSIRDMQLTLWWQGLRLRMRRQREQRCSSECTRHTKV